MRSELYGAMLFAAMFAVLIGLAELLARRTSIAPEWSRKLVHLGGGLGCLLFPFLLKRSLTVLLLALLFGGLLWLAERRRWLLSLCRVSRRSRGSVYYPFAIAGLFRLAQGRYGLYMSAVLVLTVADTAAALVGSRYGRIRYRTGGVGECKSLEGSLAFWVLAFLAVFLPLTLPAGVANMAQALLTAFLAATLLTAVEAVSIGGRDNLYVPLLAAFILIKMATKPVPELAMQSASMLLLFGLLPLINRYGRMLRTKELMTMNVIVYGVWGLGSVDWAVPVVAAFATFACVFASTDGEQRRTLVYRRMVMLSGPFSVLVLAANLTGRYAFAYGPFLAALLAPLTWGVVIQWRAEGAGGTWRWSWRQFGGATGAAAVVLAGPLLLRCAPDAASVLLLGCGVLLLVWVGIGLTRGLSPRTRGAAVFVAACLAALLTAAAQHRGALRCWRPSRWADVYHREVEVMLPSPW